MMCWLSAERSSEKEKARYNHQRCYLYGALLDHFNKTLSNNREAVLEKKVIHKKLTPWRSHHYVVGRFARLGPRAPSRNLTPQVVAETTLSPPREKMQVRENSPYCLLEKRKSKSVAS